MRKKSILTFQVVELCYNLPKGKSPHNPKLAPTPIVGGGWLTPFAFNSLRSSMNKAENPKTETAHFRLTAEEKQFLQRQADSCGLSLSNYFRSVCLGFQPRQRLTAEQIELLREVRKLRSDLVHINNYTKHNPNWSGIRSELEGIIPKLTDLLDY